MFAGKTVETPAFTSPSLLLVEGKDEYEFLPFLAKQRNIFCPRIWNMDGRGNLMKSLLAIRANTGFQNIQKIGLILDSEDNLSETAKLYATFESFLKNKAPAIQRSYLQLPSTTDAGSFERICLNSIDASDPILACSQQLVDCLQNHPNALSTQALRDSAQLLAWYTAKSGKPISRIGISAQSTFKLDALHSAFNPIANFIAELQSNV